MRKRKYYGELFSVRIKKRIVVDLAKTMSSKDLVLNAIKPRYSGIGNLERWANVINLFVMKKQKRIKHIFHFPDECVKCEYKDKFGEDICSICKMSKSVNAEKVIITTTVNME